MSLQREREIYEDTEETQRSRPCTGSREERYGATNHRRSKIPRPAESREVIKEDLSLELSEKQSPADTLILNLLSPEL